MNSIKKILTTELLSGIFILILGIILPGKLLWSFPDYAYNRIVAPTPFGVIFGLTGLIVIIYLVRKNTS